MGKIDLLGRMFRMARNRDGQAAALEPPLGLEQGHSATPFREPNPPEVEVLEATATKVLDGWLANRRQTLTPHTLNFRVMSAEQSALLVSIMAAAAQADGQVDASETRQLPVALERAGAAAGDLAKLEIALASPQPLGALLSAAIEADVAAHAYAVALLAINRKQRVNQAFLDYVALRLGLTHDVARNLERRYRA